jgi:hypothetical protein
MWCHHDNACGCWPGAGILALLECLPLDGTIHVYGFNWSPEAYDRHFMDVESSFIKVLGKLHEGRLVIHPTPCNAYTKCGRRGG